MLSIGWLMFWKALIVSALVGIGESWRRYRKRRREEGLPLRLNRKSGTYVVNDWTERLERYARIAWNVVIAATVLWWIVLAALILIP